MFEVCILGTMSAVPTADRALNSTLLLHNGNKFLIDCGEGVQQRLLQSGLGFSGISDIFISHGHIDHFIGLAGVVLAKDTFQQEAELRVHADSQVIPLLERLISLCDLRDRVTIHWTPIHLGAILETEHLVVRAIALRHSVPCYGFLFEERTKRKFSADRATRLGVPRGKWNILQKGGVVSLADGRQVTADDVLDPPTAGCSVAYIADTIMFEELVPACQKVTCLICEATYLDADIRLAEKYHHLTAKQTALLARDAKVKALLVNHLSHRYNPSEVAREIKQYFPDVIVPKDLGLYKIGPADGVQVSARKLKAAPK